MPGQRRLTRITADELRAWYHYDLRTGIFTRLTNRGGYTIGTRAGYVHHQGYRWIGDEQEHHLAWLYMYSVWPSKQIDHKNGVRSFNAIRNLREATQSQNSQNQRKATIRNKIGLLGVSKCWNKYQAQIEVKGRRFYIGAFNTPGAAHKAYLKAKRQLHEYGTL